MFKIDGSKKIADIKSLKLIEEPGEIQLVLCDEVGIPLPGGVLIAFMDDGTIELCHGVDENLIDVDDDGYIKIGKE